MISYRRSLHVTVWICYPQFLGNPIIPILLPSACLLPGGTNAPRRLNTFLTSELLFTLFAALPVPLTGTSGSLVMTLYVAFAGVTSNCTVALPSRYVLFAVPDVL